METTVLAEAAEQKTYYSKAPHLIVRISNPVPMMANGTVIHHGGKDVEFQPLGDGWGRYITTDPEEIRVLDKSQMCVDPATYNDMTTPDSVKVKMGLEERTRLITLNTTLQKDIEELKAKLKQPQK